MAYEDPNAPLPNFDGFAQEPKPSVDQSRRFFGRHHPWRRFFARTVEIVSAGFLLFLLLIFAFSATLP